jgi:cysteinyl-tRNA synthetase
MCYKHLGETIDIHAGGVDLVFPHHENEIAQSEAYTGKLFSNYWIHNGFVNINDEKMSKSLKNFKTLRDIAVSPFDARAFRFMVVTSQYRSPLNFNPETLKAASNSLKRIDKLINNLKISLESVIDHTILKDELLKKEKYDLSPAENTDLSVISGGDTDFDLKVDNYIKIKDEEMDVSIKSALLLFEDSMCDDMNTPRAVAALFQIIGLGEKILKSGGITKNQINLVLQAIAKIDIVFGVLYDVPIAYFNPKTIGKSDIKVPLNIDLVPENILSLANKRMDFKIAKDFANSDLIRKELTSLGYEVIDRKFEFDIYEI